PAAVTPIIRPATTLGISGSNSSNSSSSSANGGTFVGAPVPGLGQAATPSSGPADASVPCSVSSSVPDSISSKPVVTSQRVIHVKRERMILKAESPDSASLVVDVKPSSPANDEEVLMQVDDQGEAAATATAAAAIRCDRFQGPHVISHHHVRSLPKVLGSSPSSADLRPTSVGLTGHAAINQRVQNHALQVKPEGAVASKEEETHTLLKGEMKTEPPEAGELGSGAQAASADIPHSSSAHTGTPPRGGL
ncbi:hypothetical protein BIW11_11746, partial [Tropilaelaps mercedesae]